MSKREEARVAGMAQLFWDNVRFVNKGVPISNWQLPSVKESYRSGWIAGFRAAKREAKLKMKLGDTKP